MIWKGSYRVLPTRAPPHQSTSKVKMEPSTASSGSLEVLVVLIVLAVVVEVEVVVVIIIIVSAVLAAKAGRTRKIESERTFQKTRIPT